MSGRRQRSYVNRTHVQVNILQGLMRTQIMGLHSNCSFLTMSSTATVFINKTTDKTL